MNPVRVAIVGMGNRGVYFLEQVMRMSDVARVTAIVDINAERLRLLKEHVKFDGDLSDDYEAVSRRDDVDAILISTEDYLHVGPAIAGLKANKNLYIEKPLATTLEDCDKIIEAMEKSESICYLGFNLRHGPVHSKVHDLIEEGKLGKVLTIEANEYYYGGRTYFRRWNRLRKFGGGLWLTKASHDFDLLNWMSGAKPISVYATSSLSHYKPKPGVGPRCRDCKIKDSCPDFYDVKNPTRPEITELWRKILPTMEQDGPMALDICLYNSDKDTFDNGIAVVNYENDIRATYTVNVVAALTTRQIRVVGTEAMIEADMMTGQLTLTERHTEKTTEFNIAVGESHGGADDRILGHFFEVCINGGTPRSGLEDGRLAVRLALAARESDDRDALVRL